MCVARPRGPRGEPLSSNTSITYPPQRNDRALSLRIHVFVHVQPEGYGGL